MQSVASKIYYEAMKISKRRELLIVKLGGSVITHKESSTPRARIRVIKRLAREVKELIDKGYKLVIVHGTGSYGHPIVKKFNLHKGTKTPRQRLAYAQTLSQLLALNEIVIGELVGRGVPAVALAPRSFVTQSEGKFGGFDHKIIDSYLETDHVPVLFGDAVLDDQWGCSILSGDTIVSYLAQKLKARTVIFLSDVDGVFDKDPQKGSSAHLIKEITDKNFQEVIKLLDSSNSASHNVTGEMRGKIAAIKNNLSETQVYIVNGLKEGNILRKTVEGDWSGTRLYFG